MSAAARAAAAFVAAGACSSCPHRGTCHESRKRIQDELHGVGRQYECPFYRSIEAKLRPVAVPRRGPWGRIFGSGA